MRLRNYLQYGFYNNLLRYSILIMVVLLPAHASEHGNVIVLVSVLYHGFEGLSLITVPIHEGEA